MPATRYLPRNPFTVRLDGVRYVFNPDHQEGGLPGYPKLPKGMSKQQRDSFYKIDVPGSAPVVEQATAAPGEKRSTTKPVPGEDNDKATAKPKSKSGSK